MGLGGGGAGGEGEGEQNLGWETTCDLYVLDRWQKNLFILNRM